MEAAFTFLKNRRTGDSNSASLVIPHFSDDGSYFDLQFALPDIIPEEKEDELSDNEKELNFDNDGEKNVKLKLSPSEDEILLEDESSKFLVSLVKSASKFRFLLLNLKRSKSVNGSVEKSEDADEEEEREKGIEEKQGKSSSKFLSVKFKIDDVKLPLVSSLFTSSKEVKGDSTSSSSSSNLECNSGKLSKEMVHKYLKMVKPLYFLVSKNNYMGKLKLSGGSGAVEKKSLKSSNNNLVAKLKFVSNNLGKLQSDVTVVTGRHDDSMLEVQDGIQGAILHCKKSFHASKSTGMESSSILCPLMQDTCETPPLV